MSQTVLVIDSNAAVQAITALALNQTNCAVESLSDGTQAYARIKALRPSVVLCAKEIAGIDPFELCKKIKGEFKETAFVMLAPAEAVNATSAKAKEYEYDEVLFKPFKSNRLREVVTGLFERAQPAAQHPAGALISLHDGLRRRIVERFVGKHGVACTVTNGALESIPPASFDFCVLDSASTLPSWLDETRAGKVVLIGQDAALAKRFPHALVLTPPLTGEKLVGSLGPFPAQTAPVKAKSGHVDEREQALIAAQISAAVFQRLLTTSAVQQHSWEEIAQFAHDEVLRIGSEHDRKRSK